MTLNLVRFLPAFCVGIAMLSSLACVGAWPKRAYQLTDLEMERLYALHYSRFVRRARLSAEQEKALTMLVEGPISQRVEAMRRDLDGKDGVKDAVRLFEVLSFADMELRKVLDQRQFAIFREEFPTESCWAVLAATHSNHRK